MTNLYFFHLHAGYSIFQNFFCAGIQFFIVLNSYKILTEKSRSIGMTSIQRTSSYGNTYDVNLYSIESQKFIIAHLNDIVPRKVSVIEKM